MRAQPVKIYDAMQGVPGMNQTEIEEFLTGSQTLLRLATVDQKGEPAIHPVWYYFQDNVIYIWTSKTSRKARNMISKNRVYFSIDTDSQPYKGVKGKATASILNDPFRTLEIAKKIVIKYLGNLDNAYGKLLSVAKPGSETVIEIVPDFYTVWEYGKRS